MELTARRRQLLAGLAGFALVLAVLSLTIGRELYTGAGPGLGSFAITHFAGYLFFLLMPVEGAFVYYLTFDPAVTLLVAIAVGTALAAQAIDYLAGHFIGEPLLRRFVRADRLGKAQVYIERYGNATILVFNLLPLSSPIVVLAAGMLKFPPLQVALYCSIGLVAKYSFLALVFA